MFYNELLVATNYFFPHQKGFYRGKVRDVYDIDNKYLVVVACDRISAFDHVLPRPIPYKGQVLNQVAAHFLLATKDICPNWLISTPDQNVSIGYKCKPYKIEMVIRGYLAGHAWREYKEGKRIICGVAMPDGLKENDKFSEPIITPTLKADKGHDLDMSKEEIIANKICFREEFEQLENYTRKLFARGTEMAEKQGLLLVDTKYEFGNHEGEIMLIDEVHTPDSSRYFYKNEYAERQQKGEDQIQLSKEFVRRWLIDHDFMGLEGQKVPEMNDEFILHITEKYIELYNKITGIEFEKISYEDASNRIEENIKISLESLSLQKV